MMKKMKGLSMPEDIGMTVIFLIILLVMAIMLLFIFLQLKFPFLSHGQFSDAQLISYSIDFVTIGNKPMLLAEVLTHAQLGDRQLIEQSIEAVATGSPDNANSAGLPKMLKDFISIFKLSSFSIKIKTNNDLLNIESLSELSVRCGAAADGWCVSDMCDVGRIKIDDNGQCGPKICCKEDKDAYGKPYTVCGDGKGVCSEGTAYEIKDAPIQYFCSDQRTKIETEDCKDKNSGKTPVCCGPKTTFDTAERGIASTTAVVPLLYKNKTFGTLEVSGR